MVLLTIPLRTRLAWHTASRKPMRIASRRAWRAQYIAARSENASLRQRYGRDHDVTRGGPGVYFEDRKRKGHRPRCPAGKKTGGGEKPAGRPLKGGEREWTRALSPFSPLTGNRACH